MTPPTVVLLHGVGLDGSMWSPVAERLGDHMDIRCPDLPGHGVNPPVPADVTLDDLAAEVAAQIPFGAHLVGFSLGALVAQYIARYHPGRIASLTSVASVCKRTPEERSAVLGRLAMAEHDFDATVQASLHRWYDGTDVPDDVVGRTERVLRATDHAGFVNCYRVFATGDARIGPHLGRIDLPSLAITGALDPGSTPEMTHRLAASIPGCRAVVVDGARHMLPVQYPSVLADHLIAFIGEHAHA